MLQTVRTSEQKNGFRFSMKQLLRTVISPAKKSGRKLHDCFASKRNSGHSLDDQRRQIALEDLDHGRWIAGAIHVEHYIRDRYTSPVRPPVVLVSPLHESTNII